MEIDLKWDVQKIQNSNDKMLKVKEISKQHYLFW
jgi:hypothetical protein